MVEPNRPKNIKIKEQIDSLPVLVEEKIEQLIEDGIFPKGSKLPAEYELAKMLGVSRASLREALGILQNKGRISRTPGLGTFVREKNSVENPLDKNLGATEVIKSMKLIPGTLEIIVKQGEADEIMSNKLNIPLGSSIVVVERVRTASEKPAVYLLNIFSKVITPDFEVPENYDGSLYELLEKKYNHSIDYGVATIIPIESDAKISQKLKIKKGTPLLLIDQINYDRNDRPLMCCREYWISNIFKFTLFRRRRPSRS